MASFFFRVSLGVLAFFGVLIPLPAQVPNTLKWTLTSPSNKPQRGAEQGSAIAFSGNLAIIGAHLDDTRETDSGVVKVFDITTGQLLHTLINPNPTSTDYFGFAVAAAGTRVVVGAIGDDEGAIDAGRAYVYDLSTATPTVPIATLNNPTPATSDNFGWSVTISGNRVVIGARTNDTPTANAGSVYVYDLGGATPTIPTLTINNPTPEADEYFGTSVALEGSLLVVGADWENTGASHAGSAYVYDLASATPAVPTLTLNNPAPNADDWFGGAVAISGSRIVVSARADDVGESNAGSVYVYDLSSATPTTPVVTLNDTAFYQNGFFGLAVAISGSRVAVSARRNLISSNRSGTAFIFDVASATPRIPVRTLEEASPGVLDNFGAALALSGNTVLISSSRDDTFAQDAGRTWVYDLAGSDAPLLALDHVSLSAGDSFGVAVAMSGTLLMVGAEREGTGGNSRGSAYVYDLASTTPNVPLVALDHPLLNDSIAYFGSALGISGQRAVVGAKRSGGDQGRAWVYDFTSATPSQPIFALQDPSPSNFFGQSVAISGNYVAVSVPNNDTGAQDAGRVYLYDLSRTTPAVPLLTINNPAPVNFGAFGVSVAMSGQRLVVGASRNQVGNVVAGAAYVYDVTGANPTAPIRILANPSPSNQDRFGERVAISGNYVVVSAPNDDFGATDSGRAYVYDLGGSTPTVPLVTFDNPSPADTDNFGSSVAISGTRVVIAAQSDDSGGTDAGRAYVYDLGEVNPAIPVATLGKTTPAAYDGFGSSVAVSGLTVAIGALGDDITIADKGAAYVYAPLNNDSDGDGLLDLWEYAYFGTLAGHGAEDDFDGDGSKELIELALNRNPILPDEWAAPLAVNENGYLTMTLFKRAGVSYLVESAADPADASFSAATTTVLLNNATMLKVRDNFTIGAAPQRFLRLKVTPAP